jgi:hypothetical protein
MERPPYRSFAGIVATFAGALTAKANEAEPD